MLRVLRYLRGYTLRGCNRGSSGHGDGIFGLAVIYFPGDFGGGSEVE